MQQAEHALKWLPMPWPWAPFIEEARRKTLEQRDPVTKRLTEINFATQLSEELKQALVLMAQGLPGVPTGIDLVG